LSTLALLAKDWIEASIEHASSEQQRKDSRSKHCEQPSAAAGLKNMANDPAWEVEADDTPCVILEACCDSRESVRNAVEGGALRVEVCARSSLHVGGLTPSPTLVRAALAEAADVVALVRVRSGDFVYTEEELRDMVSEVRELRSVGCRGFALGCLGADQCINQILATRLAAAQS